MATWDCSVGSLGTSLGRRLTGEKAVHEFEKQEDLKGIDRILDVLSWLIWQTGYSDEVVEDKISCSCE